MASFFFSDESARIDTPAADTHPRLSAVKRGESLPLVINTASEPLLRRHEVPPPSHFVRSAPLGLTLAKRFWRWLWNMEDAAREKAPASALRRVQAEFVATLWDLQSLRANHVRDQIDSARSLRELWHLRADVFKVIAVHRGQHEAQQRLDTLDNHFPLRNSRRTEDSRGKVAPW
jgi:hypothetical protein